MCYNQQALPQLKAKKISSQFFGSQLIQVEELLSMEITQFVGEVISQMTTTGVGDVVPNSC